MKLKPIESFIKDVVLLVLILILFFGVKHIKPLFANLPTTVLALLSFILSLWFGYYVLMHLPLIDFRAYKVGDNIQKNMVLAPDAQESVVEYYWNFNVNGKEQIITNNGAYPDIKGDFIGVDTKIIKEADVPKIQDFSIETQDEDLTDYFLNQEKLIMVVSYSLEHIDRDCLQQLKTATDDALKNGYTVIGLTASGEDAKKSIKEAYNLDFDFYLCDEKVLKTIVRSNPGILKLDKGTIIQKLHYNDVDDLEL